MNRQVPWLRVVVEGVVIIASILLAFSIDAAWAGRLDRLQERDAIVSLYDDAIANATQLASVIENVQQAYTRALAFYESEPSDLEAIPADEVMPLIRSLSIPNRVSLQNGALDGLIASGRISLIRDPHLQELLADWPGQAARLDRRSDLLIQLEAQLLRGLGRHAEVQAWLMGSRSTAALNPSSLREDSEVMATLATIQREREIYSSVLERLAADLNALVAALEGARG